MVFVGETTQVDKISEINEQSMVLINKQIFLIQSILRGNMPKTRQQSKQDKNHSINEYINKTKKLKKSAKQIQKKVTKNAQTGSVGSNLRKVLLPYRHKIIKQFNYTDLSKQFKQYFNSNQLYLESILYLSITRISEQWSENYQPDTTEDLLNQTNKNYIQYWLKNAFIQLKNTRSYQSEDSDNLYSQESMNLDEKARHWSHRMLNLYGSHGKLSILTSIGRQYNIDILYTYDYTDKKVFEELLSQSESIKFASQQSQETTELGQKRKLIIHRGALPKLSNQLLNQQRVPLIWITDHQENNDQFDCFQLIPYNHKEIVNFIHQIVVLEQNYLVQLKEIHNQLRNNVVYENIVCEGEFYEHFKIPLPEIEITQIKCNIKQEKLSDLVQSMNGDVRQILNWLQFNQSDHNFKFQLLEQLTTKQDIEYNIQNQLPLFQFDKYSSEEYEDKEIDHGQKLLINISDQIIKKRQLMLIKYYKPQAYLPNNINYFAIQKTLKAVAFATILPQTTRLRKLVEQDPYKPLSQFFPDIDRFKQFDQFDQVFFK